MITFGSDVESNVAESADSKTVKTKSKQAEELQCEQTQKRKRFTYICQEAGTAVV